MTMTAPKKDLYEILDISPVATQEEIKSAYRALARRYHPDSGDATASADRFQEIHAAYEVLSDTAQRRAYDRRRAELQPEAQAVFSWDILVSRMQLPVFTEEQMIYALVDIQPAREARGQRLPINIALVIDRSTSMQGHRLDYVKAAAHQIVDELEDYDSLTVVTFSDRAEVVVPSQKLRNRARIHGRISAIWTSGGTEILQGLTAGLIQVRRFHNENTISHLLLLTDGQTYGDREGCIAESRRAGLQRISISTLGIGEDWNDALLGDMARQAEGTCFYISHPRQLRHILQEYVQGLSGIVVRDLQLTARLTEGAQLADSFRCFPSIDRLVSAMGEIKLGLLRNNSRIQVLLELIVAPAPLGERRLAQLELSGTVPPSNQRERLIFDYEASVVEEPEETSIPTAIVNAMNRINLFRMQEQAWTALESGRGEEAQRRLEAVATRLFDLGENSLARVALLEAGRITRGRQPSGKGQKIIKFGTRHLGMKG